MRRRAFIGFVLLALSHFAFANVTAALAQAGSTGGTIGKTDKSLSGNEETPARRPNGRSGAESDRPRATPRSKRPATNSQETSSGAGCSRIVGSWRWYLGATTMTFSQDGTVEQSISGNKGHWSCSGGIVKAVFATAGSTDRITLAKDGNSASVTTTWGGGRTFNVTRQ